ncbi:hypothetical protein [Serratia proteamaculans]|uniref:Glycosyltransferase RgtA/B/C/D-like domain-containing protein n=1 Tax=Serratia proteamaculans TaxID=28151 RepID=A0A5Q2VGD0_SERPR|nr:hypothetical protein [Serratia proteamaculans]QGH63196.1 hypothetical protein GHV41_21185 [Serratia proteamaculans]
MSSSDNVSRKYFYLVISILAISYYNALFYPGYLTTDSVYILQQTTGVSPLSNWHPIFVTKLWGGLYSIFKSAGGIWSVQILLFVVSVATLSYKIKNIYLSILFLIVILFFPAIVANMGALWKDDWAAIATIVSVIAFINYIQERTKVNLALLLTACIFTSLLRIDYFAIVLPLIILSFFSIEKFTFHKKILTTILFMVIVLISTVIINKALSFNVEKRINPWLAVAIWDISGIEQRSTPNHSSNAYNCNTVDPLMWGENKMFVVNLPEGDYVSDPKIESDYFLNLWFNSVLKNPTSYIAHRLCVGKAFLGINTASVHYPYPAPVFLNNHLTQKTERSNLNIDAYWFFDENSSSPIFRYWYYLTITLTLVIIMNLFKKYSVIHNGIALSIFLSAIRFIILPAADFRYGLWIVFGTIILLFMSIDEVIGTKAKKLQTTP